jgi:preprotein translocase subunit SecE
MGDEVSIHKSTWHQIRDYVSDVRVEMKRVTWPGKQEIYGTTVMVILTTFLFGIYFWVCDQIFSRAVTSTLRYLIGRG